MQQSYFKIVTSILFIMFLTGCGFHLQGSLPLAQPLHRLYLQSANPYGVLVRHLKEYLKSSNVELVDSPGEATTILNILHDETIQQLISVSSTQQTRQYNLGVIVLFNITDSQGAVMVPTQLLTENRVLTMQSNQILGSSNEARLFYQQMRRSLAYSIMNRLASQDITSMILNAQFNLAHPKNESDTKQNHSVTQQLSTQNIK